MTTDFAKELKKARNESGLTQQQVAEKLFISRSLYAKYESGIAFPDDETIQKILTLLKIDDVTLGLDDKKVSVSLKEYRTQMMIKRIVLVAILVICFSFLAFVFLPFLPIKSYKVIQGQHAERISTFMSAFVALNKNGYFYGNVATCLCIIQIILTLLSLIKFREKGIVVRFFTYILFAATFTFAFLTIAVSVGLST